MSGSAYAYEARKRAHILRGMGFSFRKIATELGVSVGMVQKYLAEPVREADSERAPGPSAEVGVYPSTHPLTSVNGILPYRDTLPIWGNASFNVFPLVTAGVKGIQLDPMPNSLDDLGPTWVAEPESRWTNPRCWCQFRVWRYYKRRKRLVYWTMGPDDEQNDVRPLVRCPVHNPLVRAGLVGNVKTDNTGEVFRNVFTNERAARSAVEYARTRKVPVPYIKSSYLTPAGKVWLCTSRGSITYRQRSKDRGYEQCDDTPTVLPVLDAVLQGIDRMVNTRAANGWEVLHPTDHDHEDRDDTEPEPYEEITGNASVDPIKVTVMATGRAIEYGDECSDSEWPRIQKVIKGLVA